MPPRPAPPLASAWSTTPASPGLWDCARAAALEQSGLPAGDLTHLITVSCTGFNAPGVDVALIKGLGLAPTIERTHVGFMGCHGALNALRVAAAFTGSDPAAHVLVCAVELCGLHFHYGWDPKKMVANALFADGAAAVVGAPVAAAPEDAWSVAASGSCLFADSEPAMGWRIGDHGFEMSLSIRVPNLIGRHLRPRLEDWLRRQGLALGDVGSWAVHPGGPGIVSAVVHAPGAGRGGGDGFPRRAGRVRQHVFADDPVHPRSAAPPASAASLRRSRLWAGAGGGVCSLSLGVAVPRATLTRRAPRR